MSGPRNVHITLVGGQPKPVYNGIAATNPDLVEFVYSAETTDIKERVAKEIGCECASSAPLAANDMEQITRRAQELREKYRDDRITLNISGGTKPWAHLFAQELAQHPRCTTIFIDQNNTLWDFAVLQQKPLDLPFDIPREIRLQGTPLASYKKMSEYTDAEEKDAKEIQKLRWQSGYTTFNRLFAAPDKKDALYNQIKQNPCGEWKDQPANQATVTWETEDVNGETHKKLNICIYDKKGLPHHCNISSPHAVELLFHSGWFEYQVAKVLSRWDKAKDVLLNCVFKAKNDSDKNEVDIIVSTGVKFIFVECKTQIHDISDIDKFAAVVDNYGGKASKALFIREVAKDEKAKEKCTDHRIMDCLLSPHFGNNPQGIYKMLDEELQKSHT